MVSSNILIALFAVFFGVVTSLIFLFARGYGKSKDGFFVSFRNIGFLLAAISAAMAWTNSPAFFISFFQSYTNGLTGLFWFSFGNIITLMVYSFGAQKVRAVIPQGYTFSEFMGKLHGQRLQKVYMFCLSLVAVLTLCTGLITLTKTLSIVIGVNQLLITILANFTASNHLAVKFIKDGQEHCATVVAGGQISHHSGIIAGGYDI